MPEVTLDWLNQNAKQLVKKHWGILEIPEIIIAKSQDDISIERKLDWDKYVGFYCSGIKTIVLNNEINKKRTLRSIKRTLLHELVHWRLHTTGKPWNDSDVEFAKELIRVGLGRRHNNDEQSQLAAKEAWKDKKNEFFELIERNDSETISIRLSHTRKNRDDFKRDLAKTLIRMYNTQKEDIAEGDYFYPPDVADKMKEWYGYKLHPIAKYGIVISSDNGWGTVGDRDDIAELLTQLDVDPNIILNGDKNNEGCW